MKLLLDRMGARASDLIIQEPTGDKQPDKVTPKNAQGDAHG